MMKKTVITFILSTLLMFSFSVDSKTKKSKTNARWSRLMKLVDKEIKSIHHLKRKGPRLQYRLFELYSEKIKLLKEIENQAFLESNGKRKKHTYFTESKRLQKKAEKFGLSAIRAFPRYDKNSQIYYTLALNSRDYGSGKNVEKYLYRALKNSPAGSPTIYKAKTALGEYYYNDKKYKTAVNYYRSVMKHKGETRNDEWLSKHHYNFSWCYMKLVKYDKAIQHLQMAFKLSQNKKYIDVSDQVFNSVPLFYLYAGEIREGVQFLIKYAKRPGDYLSKLASLAADRGSLKDSEYILERAYREAKDDGDTEEMIKLTLKKLEIYRNFKQNTKHYRTSKELAKLHAEYVIPKKFHDQAVEQLKGQVGYLQVRLKAHPSKSNKYLRPIITYFNILKDVDKAKTDEYYYYQGETLFQADKRKVALKAYIRGLRFAKDKKGRKEIKKKLVDAVFFALDQTKLKTKTKTEFYRESYEFFLAEWPREKRSEAIYDKLFNIYLKQGEDRLAHKLFLTYSKYNRKDINKQRGFAALLIDHYVKTKDTDKLSEWVIKIDKGYLNFKRDYIEKGLVLLAQILFESLETQAKEGQIDEAIVGYIKIYNNKKYPRKIHSKAALNIAAMELNRANTANSAKWTTEHIKKSTLAEIQESSQNLFGITENILLLQDFRMAHSLSSYLLTSLCNKNIVVKNKLYRYSATLPVFDGDEKTALENLNKFKKCNVQPSVIKDSISYLIQYSLQNRNYDFFMKLHQKEGQNYLVKNEFAQAYIDFYWDAVLNDKEKVSQYARKMVDRYSRILNSRHVSSRLSEMIHFENFVKMSKGLKWSFGDPKKFNESEFTSKLGANLKKLEFVDQDAQKLLNYKHPIITLAVFEALHNSYENFSLELSKIKPHKQPKEFQSTFNQQVSAINSSIIDKAEEYKKFSAVTSMKQGIFNHFGSRLTKIYDLEKRFKFRYPASQFLTPSNKIDLPGGAK